MITIEKYQYGLIDICDSLVTDLLMFLKDEGRYKYRMIGNMKKVTDFFESFYDNQSDEDIEIYERILYLMHKSIYHDYKRLRNRKLSPADSVICIIRKLLEYIPEYSEIKDIFGGFYDNIRNRGKLDKLDKIDISIKDAIKEEKLGKLRLQDINLYLLEHPSPKTQEIIEESQKWGVTNGEEIKL